VVRRPKTLRPIASTAAGVRTAASTAALTASLLLASCASSTAPRAVEALPAVDAVAPTSLVSLTAGRATVLPDPTTQATGDRTIADADIAAITQEIERRLASLEECYRDRLATNPDLHGEVLIHWGIRDDGEFDHGCISEDSVADKVVVGCVNNLIADGRYPESAAYPVDVEYSFVFGAS